MIVHQHESRQFQAKTLGQLGRRSQEPSPIGIVQKQCSRPMPPVHHMRPRPCNVDSQCSCHAHPRQYRQSQSVNCLDATPLPFSIAILLQITAPDTVPFFQILLFACSRPVFQFEGPVSTGSTNRIYGGAPHTGRRGLAVGYWHRRTYRCPIGPRHWIPMTKGCRRRVTPPYENALPSRQPRELLCLSVEGCSRCRMGRRCHCPTDHSHSGPMSTGCRPTATPPCDGSPLQQPASLC